MSSTIRVTIWNEFRHEKHMPEVQALYPDGMHATIASYLSKDADIEVTLAALDDPEQGLPDEVLNNTDVLLWWGHCAHHEVRDDIVAKIQNRVYQGKMGLVVLHSGHHSKVFRSVVGTTGNLSWGRDQKEIVWCVNPAHPIAAGIPDHFCLELEELYAEPFAVQPDELIFTAWFEDGYIMRNGMVFNRGYGKVFYFQPGHESCPSYHNEYVERIINNGIRYVKPNAFGFDIPEGAPCVHPHKITDEFTK